MLRAPSAICELIKIRTRIRLPVQIAALNAAKRHTL
jgi:hypothetical protein